MNLIILAYKYQKQNNTFLNSVYACPGGLLARKKEKRLVSMIYNLVSRLVDFQLNFLAADDMSFKVSNYEKF